MREFIHLSRSMNMTKTAVSMNLSQSTLSSHVAQMEKELGTDLLERMPNKIRLTPAGYEFLEVAAGIVNAYDGFVEKCRHKGFSGDGHFTVQVLQHADAATFALLGRIREFKELNPGAQVEVRESIAFDAPEAIRAHLADCGYFGIRLHDPEPEEGVLTIPVLEEPLVVWLDRDAPAYSAGRLSPKDLEGMAFPTWTGIGPNDLEDLYHELYEDYGMRAPYAPRYCISREDFFLNRVHPGDAVILTEGSDYISAVRVRGERALRQFEPPVYVRTYMCFRESDVTGRPDGALAQFMRFLSERFEREHASKSGALAEVPRAAD